MRTRLVSGLADNDILMLALLAYANSLWDEAQGQPSRQMLAFYIDSMERAKELYARMESA